MVVFSSYGMQVIMSFLMLAMIFMMWPRAQVSARRINEIFDQDISIKDGTFLGNDTKEVGTVEFKNVSFKYPNQDNYVLKNLSIDINPKEREFFITVLLFMSLITFGLFYILHSPVFIVMQLVHTD